MRPVSSAMLQQNNNNNYPCLNMTGPTGGEGLQACPRAPGPFPSRMELSLGDLPLVRGLRAWALCSKNRLKTRGELGGGGHAPTIGPTTTTSTHGRLTSCPRPADMYPAGELGGMGYGLPVGLDARQAGIGALVTVATLKTSEVGGKTQTQTQCLFLRTEKGSCLYSTTKPGGWSLGKGPGLTAGGASALVGSWLRGKVSGVGGGGGGGGGGHQAGKRTGGPPLPPPPAALQSGGSNRVRVRSGRRWRKSCNASGPGQNKTTGPGGQRRGREEAGTEVILGERQEGGDKGELHNNLQGAKEVGGGRKQEGGAGCTRSCRCCHNTLARNCARCARRAVRSGARQRPEEYKIQAADEREMNGLETKDGGKTNGGQEKGEQEKEREEEEKSRSKPIDSIVLVPNADSQTNCFYLESSSNSEASEKSHDKDIREINEPLQTKMCTYSENKGQPCSQNTRNTDAGQTLRNPSCEELNNGMGNTPLTHDVRPHSEYLDNSLPPPDGPSSPTLVVRNPVQKHCEDVRLNVDTIPAVADTEPTQDSKSPCEDPQEDGGNHRVWSDECTVETASCCEEGLHRLTSATPVEGSTFPAELSPNTMQGQQASSTADTNHNNSHAESAERGSAEKEDREDDSKGRPLELCVKSDQLMPRESSSGDLYTKEPFHEGKPLKEKGDVNCNEPEVVLSEEQRGSCNQATLSCRNEGKAGNDEANTADPAPGLREVDGLQGGSVPEAVRGMLTKAAAGEEDKRLGDEEDCRGVEFKEGRGGDELAEEQSRAEPGLESSVDGETVPELRGDDGSPEITGEEKKKENNKHDESLQDGSAGMTDDEKHGNSEGKLGEGEAEYIRLQPQREKRERRDVLKASDFTAEGQRLQEFATEWTQEASCAPSLSPPPLKEEEEEGMRQRRDGGQNPVEAGVTCCPLSLIPTITNTAAGPPLPDPPYKAHATANPAPPPLPPGAMATDPQRPGASGKSAWTESRVEVGSREGVRGVPEEEEEEEEGQVATLSESMEEPGQEEEEEEEEERLKERSLEQSAIVATEQRGQGEAEENGETHEEEEEEEDEFGGFMQADAEPGWSEGFSPSAPGACGNTENTGELTQWTSGWTDDSFHQSDDCWTAFSQGSLVVSGDPVAQLWPITAGEEQRGRLSSNQNVMDVLSEAFPSSGQLASDPGIGSGTVPTLTSETGMESGTVPTLTQLLQGERHHSRTTQDQGLLDNFHDLNKMIGQRYKRANGVSRNLLLKTLHLEPAYTEIRNISRPTNHRLSPGLPSANRHAQSSKRRLSYDHNRNIAE